MTQNFVPEVKEREEGDPCFLYLNPSEDFGLGGRTISLHLPAGTDIKDAKRLRDAIRDSRAKVVIS